MKTHTGFTLIEVLIAMLILAVGLLGLAALQTSTLRSNLAAYNHGQATQLLYDIADRMRANNCTAPATCNYIITDSNSLTGQSVTTSCATPPTGCIASVLANNDLIEWNDAIRTTLPMGKGIISSANGIFTLSVTWDDDRSGAVTPADPTFTMSLQR